MNYESMSDFEINNKVRDVLISNHATEAEFDKFGFRDLNNLAELCKTVFITQQQASVIKELKELTKKFKELK